MELEIDTVFLRSGYLALDKKYIFVKHAQTSPQFSPNQRKLQHSFFLIVLYQKLLLALLSYVQQDASRETTHEVDACSQKCDDKRRLEECKNEEGLGYVNFATRHKPLSLFYSSATIAPFTISPRISN